MNQLLDCTPEFIRNIRNMGKKSVEEIEDYLMNFINNENSIAKKYEPIRLRQIIENHIDEVYDRNFSFLSEEDQKVVGEACEIVGQDLLEGCYANPEHVIAIGKALFDFVKKTHGASQRRERLYDLILQIPEERKNNFIYSYINAYTLNEEIREQLYTLCPNKNEDFTSNALIMAISDTQLYLETVKFLKWCQFDIKQEVRAFLEKAYSECTIYFALDTLDYLQKGGRISSKAKIIANVLDINPILAIEDGLVVNKEKVRGKKKVNGKLTDLVAENISDDKNQTIAIMHANCPEKAEKIKELLIEKTGVSNYVIELLGPTIGVHTGPGAYGIIFRGK